MLEPFKPLIPLWAVFLLCRKILQHHLNRTYKPMILFNWPAFCLRLT
jgi:hypothetical protein